MTLPLLLPVLFFIAFLVYNKGSVVLGDKEHHKLSLHPAMCIYPSIIYFLMNIPRYIVEIYIMSLGKTAFIV
jgi:hypothetical protein